MVCFVPCAVTSAFQSVPNPAMILSLFKRPLTIKENGDECSFISIFVLEKISFLQYLNVHNANNQHRDKPRICVYTVKNIH